MTNETFTPPEYTSKIAEQLPTFMRDALHAAYAESWHAFYRASPNDAVESKADNMILFGISAMREKNNQHAMGFKMGCLDTEHNKIIAGGCYRVDRWECTNDPVSPDRALEVLDDWMDAMATQSGKIMMITRYLRYAAPYLLAGVESVECGGAKAPEGQPHDFMIIFKSPQWEHFTVLEFNAAPFFTDNHELLHKQRILS